MRGKVRFEKVERRRREKIPERARKIKGVVKHERGDTGAFMDAELRLTIVSPPVCVELNTSRNNGSAGFFVLRSRRPFCFSSVMHRK